ncbi:sensor domain-containing protein [Luteimicrobium sp. NPDC057192]|uniref:sensor histidine kinase n=1 Tax=Luteimicrobium sp. NPDC057192 TaxID=3346042 RepID=UPI00363288B8
MTTTAFPTATPAAPRVALSRPGALRRCLVLAGLAFGELWLLVWLIFTAALSLLWVGGYLVPGALNATRTAARRQRRLAKEYAGIEIPEWYRPLDDAPRGGGALAPWRRLVAQVKDPSTGRDVLWVVADPFVGFFIALLPIALVAEAVWGIVLLFLWRTIVDADGTQWFLFVPVSDQATAIIAAGVGIAAGVCGVLLARPALGWHALWARLVLSPSSRALEQRVEELARTRADAVDDASAEVRRIERDLHDGAQARIVAMGMSLTAAERLMETDPEAARAMLAEAKASSSAALQELRDLVRGIHPPVLADRGLVDAVRTIALESPVPVDVASTLEGRVPMPVESAVYFAVSELLANVAKHAVATRARVEISRTPQALTVVVADDGAGGAATADGSGLAGIARRLGAFDGSLTLESPLGGGTVATIRVPLAG